MSHQAIKYILESLVPRNSEELSQLRNIVNWALQVQQSASLNTLSTLSARFAISEGMDPLSFLRSLPTELHRYFHSLVEALEIYHSIHGRPISLAELTLGNRSVQEIKQIRDMCLQEGPHFVY